MGWGGGGRGCFLMIAHAIFMGDHWRSYPYNTRTDGYIREGGGGGSPARLHFIRRTSAAIDAKISY